MRRILAVGVLLVLLISISTGVASANWGLDIVATGDSEDGNWTTDGDATDWDVIYWSDSSYMLFSNQMSLFIAESTPANITLTLPAFGMPPNDINWAGHYIGAASGDQGAYSIITYMNAGSNFVHMFGAAGANGLVNGDPEIMNISADTGTSLSWMTNVSFNINENTNAVTPTLITAWKFQSPPAVNDLSTAGQLMVNGAPQGGTNPSSPAPPIPEIITIVLVSMGLIALGGYIWYRRHRKAAAVAA